MKKILLLSLVLTLLCWGFASAADVSASAKGSVQHKVVKAMPKKDNVPVSLREGAPKIEAISPYSPTNVGPAVKQEAKVEKPAPVQLMKVEKSKGPTAFAPNQSTKYNGPALVPNWYSPSMLLDNLLTEGFEGGVLPTDWVDSPGTSPWLYNNGTYHGPGAPYAGSFCAYFNIWDYSTGLSDSLETPAIDFSAHSGSYLLSFWYWHNSGSDYVKVYLQEGATVTLLQTLPNVAAWTQIVIPFASSYNGGRLIFYGYSYYGSYNPSIDDVSIDDAPSSGRCCYGDPTAPTCVENSNSECIGLGGSWAPGQTCAGDPCPVAVLGDACAAPFPITSYPYTDTRNTADFLNDYNGHGKDVVYTFTVTERSLMDFTMCNTAVGFDTWMGLWADGSCGTTTFLTSDDDGCGYPPGLSHIASRVVEIGTYYLLVEAYSADGTYTLDITSEPAPAAPANDECVNAEPIVGPYPIEVLGTTLSASIDCPGMLDWNAVWYAIDLPYGSNNVSIDFCPTSTASTTVGIVYYNDCTDCSAYTLMGYSWNYSCAAGVEPKVFMNQVAGPATIYYPVYLGTEKDFDMIVDVQEYVAPTPDFFATGEGSFTDPLQNTCGAVDNCDLRVGDDQIWQLDLPLDGRWTISLCNTATMWDSYIYLGTAICAGDIATSDDECGTTFGLGTITAPLAAGTYFLDIEGYSSADCGEYALDITYLPPCVIDIPPDATPEGETDCGAEYVDNYNGGCNSSPTIFQDIAPGDVIHGTSGNYLFTGLQYRDTDWFQYSPTEAEIVHWSVISEFPELLFVMDGTGGCASYTTVGSATAAECEVTEVVANLCPGNTYWFWIGPSVFTGYPCPKNYVATLTSEPAGEPAPNDLCTDVTPEPLVAGTPLQFTGDNTNATTCGDYLPFTGYPTVWHGFTTTECLDITLDYCGTTPAFGDAWLNLQVDCPGSAVFTYMNFDVATCPDGNVTIRYHHVPAGTYYYGVMKDVAYGAVGPYVINLNATVCPPPPANDNCANAEVVGEVVAQPWSTMDATFDGAGACMTAPNVWYLYTAPANANVTVSLCGSGFDTKLAVYDGNICPEPPPPPPTPVDFQAGEDIASAVAITDALPVSYAGTTVGYFNDYDEACTYTGGTAPEVVYSYAPTTDVTMDITMCGSSYDTKLYVYENTYTPGAPFACNDDGYFCTDDPYKSALLGITFFAGNTYYIVVDGYGTASGVYQINLLPPSTTTYVMIECNDDFCGLQSQITFPGVAGNQYLIEVGGFSANIGEGVLTISVPPAHDVAVATIDVPRIGELINGVAPIEVIATIANNGLNSETFNVVAADDHGYSSTYTNLTLDAGTSQQIAFPNLFNPNVTCVDYNFSVTTQLAGDMVPENDAMAANYRVARAATETFMNDDDVVANGWYFYAEANLIAIQYTADVEYDIAYIAARTYAGELGGAWPDATVDPFKLYLFLDADLDGTPDADPVGDAIVWPTGVSPSVSYAVLDCGVHVLPGDNFWVAFGEVDDSPAHGSEGIAQDAVTDFPAAKWYRLDGVWTQGEQYAGDEMLRAYAANALGTIHGIAYNVAPPTVLPNVHVVTYDAGNVVVNDQVTGALGTWDIILPPGTYRQHLSKIGFTDADINGIVVTGGGITNVSFNMQLQGGVGCHYVIGDANGSATFTGLDVTYSVRFFKGGPHPPYSCECTPGNTWYVSGDVNGSCTFSGLDITYMVRYFKGGAAPIPCASCPPVADILIAKPVNGNLQNGGAGQ